MILGIANTSDIAASLVAMLKAWGPLVEMGATVEDSEPVNESADRCPWVGVYRTRLGLPIRALGVGAGMRRQELSIAVALTTASIESGEQCKIRLGVLEKAVSDCLINDPSLGGSVITVSDIEVVYADYKRQDASFFQTAVVYLTAITNTIAS